MDNWVFVDTCIWAPFFTKPGSREKSAVDDLLDADRVALIGPVLGELLLGFRRKDQADWVASRLRAAHYVEVDWEDWRVAADLGRDLVSKGNKIPLTDLSVAIVARRCSAWVYTTDPHFDLIAGLKRYRPEPLLVVVWVTVWSWPEAAVPERVEVSPSVLPAVRVYPPSAEVPVLVLLVALVRVSLRL